MENERKLAFCVDKTQVDVNFPCKNTGFWKTPLPKTMVFYSEAWYKFAFCWGKMNISLHFASTKRKSISIFRVKTQGFGKCLCQKPLFFTVKVDMKLRFVEAKVIRWTVRRPRLRAGSQIWASVKSRGPCRISSISGRRDGGSLRHFDPAFQWPRRHHVR